MTRLLTVTDFNGVSDNVIFNVYYITNNYVNNAPKVADKFNTCIVFAKSDDNAVDMYCELTKIDSINFCITTCECCASVNFTISKDVWTIANIINELSAGYTMIG